MVTAILLAEIGVRSMLKMEAKNSTQARLREAASHNTYPYYDRSQHFSQYRVMSKMDYNTYLGYVPKAGKVESGYKTNGQHFRYE